MELIELLSELNIDIDVTLVAVLMAIGFCIKHIPALDKISNQLIPIVLIISAVIISILKASSSVNQSGVDTITNAIIAAAISIGLHQEGKIFLDFLKKYKNKK